MSSEKILASVATRSEPLRSTPHLHSQPAQGMVATPALPKSTDLLSHRTREFRLLDQPLERYFSMIGQRPCEGDYTARWEIEDGWLYLTDLGCVESHDKPMSMESLFPFAGRRVFAAWFSGQVRGFRTDRSDFQASAQVNRYPDLVLNLNCGRVETISLVHSSDRQKLLSPSGTLGYAASNRITEESSATGKVLAFTPRSADASWNPGWQGALV
jgi:hypothetical protein